MNIIQTIDFKVIDDVKCYAPELAYENADYPTGHFDKLYSIESSNFWFRSRNRIIQSLFSKYVDICIEREVLEIGCGTGYVLHGLSKFKNLKLTGAELHVEGLKFAKRRLPNVDFLQMDARKMPFKEEEFDIVGAFDVLEHIEEDEVIMNNVYKILKQKGLLFITVPQHKWLWSTQDEASYHKRRYTRKEIVDKLSKANFNIIFASSFVFFLLPLMFLSRLIKRKSTDKEILVYDYGELIFNPVLNRLFDYLMRFDEILIQLGLEVLFGGSMIVVARKS